MRWRGLTAPFRQDAWEWLGHTLGLDPGRMEATRMKGSTSSSIYLIRSGEGAATGEVRFVLRVLDNQAWLAQEPDLAAHEAAALELAQAADLRAPRPIAFTPQDTGFGGPAVLMTFLEGVVDLRPRRLAAWLDALASELAAIHRTSAAAFPWRFRSWVDRSALAPPAWSSDPRAWERAIELWLGPPPPFRPVFLHRDYHPTNLLWERGAITGTVDWIDACAGPAGVDVAHCRTNLALMFGPAAADRFLAAYMRAAGGFDFHPYWEVDSLLNSCLPEPVYYEPWREFGLSPIPAAELIHRIDSHLQQVMRHI